MLPSILFCQPHHDNGDLLCNYAVSMKDFWTKFTMPLLFLLGHLPNRQRRDREMCIPELQLLQLITSPVAIYPHFVAWESVSQCGTVEECLAGN